MRPRLPLSSKVLFLAFLNLCLLGLVLAGIMRAQFRLDPGSFLLAPAQSRILQVSGTLALELNDAAPQGWEDVLARYGRAHGVAFTLLDERGVRIAGPAWDLPREVADRIPRRPQPPGGPPPERRAERGSRSPRPPLFLTATANPTRYWAGVRIPLRRDRDDVPHPGTLLITSSSLLASKLFFDVTPWLTIGAAVILISVACWLPFIRGLTRSIAQMTNAAGQIAEGRFEIQVADRRRDEIGQLGAAVNRMSARLASFVNGQRRFLSGIAHELCTPIATIQFGLGGLERRVDESERQAVADIQEEVQHMSALVDEILSFTRAGMQALDVKLSPVNVAATVARVLEREASPEVKLEVSVDEKLNALADAEYLFRALSNLVRNAIRYAGRAGPIQISARTEADLVSITVADQGPGLPEENLEDVFAPFYRLDASRSQETGGLGLGLAIVRTCVESCHGTVHCRNRKPKGLEVEIRLPSAKL